MRHPHFPAMSLFYSILPNKLRKKSCQLQDSPGARWGAMRHRIKPGITGPATGSGQAGRRRIIPIEPALFLSASAAIACLPTGRPIRCCDEPSAGGLAPQTLHVLHEYASGPQGSARRSRDAAPRFRDEPS
jgi:hypothetical protein